jgi:ABC-type glycerol-3-phosphate transport system permease component
MWQRFQKITLPLLMPAILVALIFRTLDALRVFDLPFVLTRGANGTTSLSIIAQQTFAENRIYGLGSAYAILTFITVDDRRVHLHPGRGRQPARPRGGLAHGEHCCRRPRAATDKKKKQAESGKPHTPWWMWLSVAAIVVFCLFPFYWLVNLSLKTGDDLSTTPVPPNHRSTTTSRSSGLELHDALQTARSWPCHHRAGDHRRARSAPTRWHAASSGSSSRSSRSSSRSRRFPQIAIAAPLFRCGGHRLYNTIPGL